MNSDNVISIRGRLTKDIELRYTPSQLAVARFTVAVNRTRKDKNGERVADFIPCVAFGVTAENMDRHSFKGQDISVVGELHSGSYEKDGGTVYTYVLVSDSVAFHSWKELAPAESTSNTARDEISQPDMSEFTSLGDDDMPF